MFHHVPSVSVFQEIISHSVSFQLLPSQRKIPQSTKHVRYGYTLQYQDTSGQRTHELQKLWYPPKQSLAITENSAQSQPSTVHPRCMIRHTPRSQTRSYRIPARSSENFCNCEIFSTRSANYNTKRPQQTHLRYLGKLDGSSYRIPNLNRLQVKLF